MELIELKKKYNAALDRNKNAEEYFKNHTVEECLKYLDLFNEVVKELSSLIIQIEISMGKHMTEYEKLNGFKL
ncbi:hypothetical protein [Clostridium beijerinckii]|jgi:hypothetical protein|uniref:hypothetical protein n=1 Tax=Clostridium beijerinckii TaxID=1520 RepID=UPI00232FA70C|nr:hypothetical protein [Clostridium beijerinckii]